MTPMRWAAFILGLLALCVLVSIAEGVARLDAAMSDLGDRVDNLQPDYGFMDAPDSRVIGI
jgi:hypothetical protein